MVQVLMTSIPFTSSLLTPQAGCSFKKSVDRIQIGELEAMLCFAGAQYCACLASTAQAIPANLFASATTTFAQGRVNRVWIEILSRSVLFSTAVITDLAPSISNFRRVRLPRLLIPPILLFSPLEYCSGVSQIQTDILRPFLNCLASPTAEISALPTMGPIHGIWRTRW